MFQLIKNFISQQIDFPYDIEQITVDPEKPYDVQLKELIELNKKIYCQDDEILKLIEKNEDTSKILLKCAPLFDFDEKTKGNGYYTLIILFIKCLKITSTPGLKAKIGKQPIFDILQILNQGFQVARELHVDRPHSKIDINESTDKIDKFLFTDHLDFGHLINIIQSLEPQFKTFYLYFNFSWLGSMTKVMQLFTNFLAIYSSHYKSFKVYNWLNRETRAIMFTHMVLNIHVDCLKSMWNITDFPLVRIFTPSYWYRFFILQVDNIYCPRQQRWIIDSKKPIVHDLENDLNINLKINMNKKMIRCLLLRNKNVPINEKKSLLIHVHGGGFISQSPESHATYLNRWVKQLKNITILSIDYSLSPEAVFPEAIQEMLDCYLWLLSGDPEVKNKLGFFPEKIAFCGDSAGGNMSMALMSVLSIIQKKVQKTGGNLKNYRYPDGLFLFYSPFILATMVSPSRILSSVDGLVPLGSLLNCLDAYAPKDVLRENQKPKTINDGNEENQTVVHQLMGYTRKITELCKYFLDFQWEDRPKPWYKKDESFEKSLNKLNEFLRNPFVSPLLADNIADYNHIPLFLYPLTFDSFLDDSIEMAKKWQRDKVHLEIIDEVPHGFLNLIDFNAEAKEKSLFCIKHMLNILN